jgi:hypothetical protein
MCYWVLEVQKLWYRGDAKLFLICVEGITLGAVKRDMRLLVTKLVKDRLVVGGRFCNRVYGRVRCQDYVKGVED